MRLADGGKVGRSKAAVKLRLNTKDEERAYRKKMQESLKYYLVEAKCGHVGKTKYIPIVFAVKANSQKEASGIVRTFPRVKHDHKYAIIDCREVRRELYEEALEKNNNDPYLKCKNKQEQALIPGLDERLVDEDEAYCECHKSKNPMNKNAKILYIRRNRGHERNSWL